MIVFSYLNNISKAILLLSLCFHFFSLNAQFEHRLQVEAGYAFLKNNEQVNSFEDAVRIGKAYSFGVSYILDKFPVLVSLRYIDGKYVIDEYLQSDVTVLNDFNNLYKNTLELNIEYELIKRATLTPIIFLGINYNSLNLIRNNLVYDYPPYVWGYEEIKVAVNALGYSAGAMLKLRISDNVGVFYRRSIEFVKQDNSKWLEPTIIYHSNHIGVYLRLLKRIDL